MTWNDHDHHGLADRPEHDHDLDYAGKQHRHGDLERDIRDLRAAVRELRGDLDDAISRIRALENTNIRLAAALDKAAGEHEHAR